MALFQSGKKAPEAASPKKAKKAKADAETEDVKEDDAGEAAAASLPGRQVLTLGKQEIDALTTVAESLQNEKIAPSEMRDLVEKVAKRKNCSEKVRTALAALDSMRAHAGLDGALFGRMATGIAVFPR